MFECTVQDRNGMARALWPEIREGRVLLVFLRQYGCVGCNAFVTRLAPRLYELERVGVQPVFVGLGDARHMNAFLERMGLQDKPARWFTSADGTAHQAAGVPRSVVGSVGPTSLFQRLDLLRKGFTSKAVTGDPMRLSGVFLLEGGAVRWQHIAETMADTPSDVEVVQQALRLSA